MIDTGKIRDLQDQAAEYNVGLDRALDDLIEGLGGKPKRVAALWDRVEDLLTLSGAATEQLRKGLADARKPAEATT